MRELDEDQQDDKRQGEAQSSTSNGGGGEARGPLRMRITAPDPELRERPVRRLFTADSQDPELAAKQLAEKDREIRRLRERLAKAETIIEVQKKISEILSIPLNPPSNVDND
ncbi:MAG: hypothetical protein JWN15_3729 [Firmicutes bacterium]|nr:hypothetical protein [Bacillota bacterium]